MVHAVRLTGWQFRFDNSDAEIYALFAGFITGRRRKLKIPIGSEMILYGSLYGDEDKTVETLPIVTIRKEKNISWFASKRRPRAYYAETQDGSRYYFRLRDALPEVLNIIEYINKGKR